ncbi:MAG: isocitrate lyase/PEP mutase family protein [Acetobacteraceae bacterium]
MTTSQSERAHRFEVLHKEPGIFIIPNAWDGGSARVLAGLGFAAIATSSGAAAGTLGRRDHMMSREEVMAHARAIVAATDLPVSADLEKGFGDAPDIVATTIRLAAETGLVAASIEDSTGDQANPIFTCEDAVARVAAAVAAARTLPFRFMITARSENFLHGRADLDDTIKRLRAFEAAGADVLMAPALPDLAAVARVCQALSRPFNFMAGMPGRSFPVTELGKAGVKRISLATSLYRAAMSGLIGAAREAKDQGTFGYVDEAVKTAEINALMAN